MIDGCLDWQERGLAPPEAVTKATDAYFAGEDGYADWIADRCEEVHGLWSRSSELFASWRDYAEKAGLQAGDTKRFREEMERRGFRSSTPRPATVTSGCASARTRRRSTDDGADGPAWDHREDVTMRERPSSPRVDFAGSARERRAAASFSQAKNPAREPRFVPIVAKPEPPEPKLQLASPSKSHDRWNSAASGSCKIQQGHAVYEWPLVVAKELIDNGLDACEEAEVAPRVTVIVEKDTIVVQDNAGGIDADP